MVDLLACVDHTGGNKQELVARINQAIGTKTSSNGGLAASNIAMAGSAQLELSKVAERKIVLELGEKYFSGALATCAELANAIGKTASGGKIKNGSGMKLPIKRTATGQYVTFLPGFTIEIISITRFGEDPVPYNVDLRTTENGNFKMLSDGVPIDITFRGTNYQLSATVNTHKQILLTLNAR
jgi:hypothetical protein